MDLNRVIYNAKQGKQEAYQKLFDKFAKSMFASSMRITNHTEDSKDIVQESFIISFNKLDKLKDPNAFAFWLRRTVINNSLKSLKFRFELLNIPDDFTEDSEPENWYKKLSFDNIRDEIQNLSPGARTIFSLFALEGYKHKEIAEKLDISESTSKSQYRYACKQLREKLIKYRKHEI